METAAPTQILPAQNAPAVSRPPETCHQRLAALAGRRCPQCGWQVTFDGMRLRCINRSADPRVQDCGYTWSNPESAEAELAA